MIHFKYATCPLLFLSFWLSVPSGASHPESEEGIDASNWEAYLGRCEKNSLSSEGEIDSSDEEDVLHAQKLRPPEFILDENSHRCYYEKDGHHNFEEGDPTYEKRGGLIVFDYSAQDEEHAIEEEMLHLSQLSDTKAQASYTWDEIHVPALEKIYLLIEAPEDLICTSQCNKHWYAVMSQVDGIEKDKKGAPTGYWKRLVECKDPEVRKLLRAEQRAQSGKLEDVKPYLRLYKTFLPAPSEKDRLGPREKNALKVVEFGFENHPDTTEKVVFYTHYAHAQKRPIQERANLGKARQAFEQLKATQSGYELDGGLFFAWKYGLITRDDEPDAEKKRQEALSDLRLNAEQYYKEHTEKKEEHTLKGHQLYAKILHQVGKNFEEAEEQPEEEGPSNAFKAFEAYEKSANLGYRKAQYELGKMYISGRGIGAQDDEQAVKWWKKAAKQGHPEAQNLMGLAYYLGFGDMNLPLERYEERTLHWWGLAAIQGNENALLSLQHMGHHKYGFLEQTTIEAWSQNILRKDFKNLERLKDSYSFIKNQKNGNTRGTDSSFASMLGGFEKEFNGTSEAMNLYKKLIKKHPGAIYAFSRLFKNSASVSLELDRCNIGSFGAECIGSILKTSTTLRKLDIPFCQIGKEGAGKLAKALEANPNNALKILYLGGNKIGNEGVEALRGSFKSIPLEELALGTNEITKIDALVDILKHNAPLRSLHLTWNQIGDDEAEKLAGALKSNTNLEILNLWNNQISDNGVNYFIESLKTNSTLTELNLGDNEVSRDKIQKFEKILKANSSLKKLNLGGNKFLNGIFKTTFTHVYLNDSWLANQVIEALKKK